VAPTEERSEPEKRKKFDNARNEAFAIEISGEPILQRLNWFGTILLMFAYKE
jgi:hypothetical protein